MTGGTLIEPTAGNTGIGLAFAAINSGIKVIFCVPQKISIGKQELMKALGAEVVSTPTNLGIRRNGEGERIARMKFLGHLAHSNFPINRIRIRIIKRLLLKSGINLMAK